MAKILQANIQSRATWNVLTTVQERERVYAQIFNNTGPGRKTLPTRYKFFADSEGHFMGLVDNDDHANFLIASGNFSTMS